MRRALPHPSVLEGHASQGTLHRLVVAWGGRPPLTAPRSDDPLAAIARALRADLALLRARPGLLFPCLWNRLWWAEGPEAAPFYSDDDPPAGAPAAGPLRPWLRAWRASRPSFAPWLRSLRPPEHAPDGALLEECRGPFAPGGPVEPTDGGRYVTVGATGAHEGLRWDRLTGTVEVAPPPREAHDTWALAEKGWLEQVVLTRGGERLGPLPLGDDYYPVATCSSPDGRAVAVYGYDAEGWGFIALFDPAPGHRPDGPRRWLYACRGRVLGARFSADGATVVACDGARSVVLLDARTGEPRATLREEASAARLSDDGATLFTLGANVVRTWDVARLGCHRPIVGCHRGWVRAAFAPSEGRLLTGSLLCDATSGALVARLDVDSPEGYLEGGPPADGRALGDERFVEAKPGRGLRAWCSHTGRLVASQGGLSLHRRHVVAFSPDGTLYATAERSAPGDPFGREPLRIARVDGGEPTLLSEQNVTALAFRPDATSLAAGTADGRLLLWTLPAPSLRWSVRAHSGPVRSLTFDRTGALLLSAGGDGLLRLTRDADGSRVADRRAGGREELDPSAIDDEPVPAWRPTPAALAALDGWAGARTRPEGALDVAGRERDGVFELTDAAGKLVAAYPSSEPLVGSPTGRYWAGGAVHLALEGEPLAPAAPRPGPRGRDEAQRPAPRPPASPRP